MIEIKSFVFGSFQENTYILFDETKECILIDPGCYEREEKEELVEFIENNDLRIKLLLNTHCHIDHVLGNYFIKEKYKVPLLIHQKDNPTLKSVKVYAPVYGFQHYQEAEVDGFLEEGDVIKFGSSQLKVIFVPGHAPGHIAFINKELNICIGGDVLFYQSIGRTDLPGGNYDILIQSIHSKIFPLADSVVIYPGHGPETTVGHEKKYNPFCAIL